MSHLFANQKVATIVLSLVTGFLFAVQGVAYPQEKENVKVPGVVYKTDFDDVSAMTGWVLGGMWAADATPEGFPGGAAKSLPSSLNYNDGVDYDNGFANSGSAKSPAIDIADATNPQLKFWCDYQTESGLSYDKRFVKIYANGTEMPIQSHQLSGGEVGSAPNSCGAMGTWHQHTIALDPKWGSIRIEFLFDTMDAVLNKFAGWAVDDVMVSSVIPVDESSLTILFSSDFDSDSSIAGWYFDSADMGQPQWAVDATPATFPGGAAASLPNSLNYNNGVDYNNGKVNSGVAKSPGIILTGATTTLLKFQCNYETEKGTIYDKRSVKIYSNADPIPVMFLSLMGACGAMGTWHEHTIALDPAWGLIAIEFFFDTVDAVLNNFAGWAIDDVKVLGAPPLVVPTKIATTPAETVEVVGSTEAFSGGGGSCGCVGLEAIFLLAILAAARRRRV